MPNCKIYISDAKRRKRVQVQVSESLIVTARLQVCSDVNKGGKKLSWFLLVKIKEEIKNIM